MKLDWLEQEQIRMFQERKPIQAARHMDEIVVSTVFGPNSEISRDIEQKPEQDKQFFTTGL